MSSIQPREEIPERLIELYFQHDEACRNCDWPYADELQREINKTHRERRELAPAQDAMLRALDKQAKRAMRERPSSVRSPRKCAWPTKGRGR